MNRQSNSNVHTHPREVSDESCHEHETEINSTVRSTAAELYTTRACTARSSLESE